MNNRETTDAVEDAFNKHLASMNAEHQARMERIERRQRVSAISAWISICAVGCLAIAFTAMIVSSFGCDC